MNVDNVDQEKDVLEDEEEPVEAKTPKVATKKKPAPKAKVIFKKPASSAQATMSPSTDVPVEKVPANVAPVKQSKSQQIQDKMAMERRKKVDVAKKEIEAKDKVRLAETEKEAEAERKRVKAETAERKAKESAKEAKAEQTKSQTKAQKKAARREASAERQAARGRAKCPGSNLDVEKGGLEMTTGKLRENPWSKKGKRVRCPKCKRSVGIHTVGRKSQQKTPTSYNLNTHYVKVDENGKPKKATVRVKKVKAEAKKNRATKKSRAAKK